MGFQWQTMDSKFVKPVFAQRLEPKASRGPTAENKDFVVLKIAVASGSV